jgi:rfaE bifunctional protein nucleotidyltransferase chain/domain
MPNSKIIKKENLKELVISLKKTGKKIGLSHGVFDLVHPGHVQHFIASKKMVDVLFVSVTEDKFVNKGPGRPAFTHQIRLETLAALEAIDHVVLSESSTSEILISIIQPDFYFKGSDYKNPSDDHTGKITAEKQVVESHGGQIFFTNELTSSSSTLINQYFNSFSNSTQNWLASFKEKYSVEDVFAYLDQLSNLEIVLTGEIIIDQYTDVNPLSKSSKDPILAFHRKDTNTFAGGVLAVANNCAAWAQSVKVISFIGHEDSYTVDLVKMLNKKIDLDVITLDNRPTVRKHRFVDTNSKTRVFEYYDYVDDTLGAENEKEILSYFDNVNNKQVILVTDYGHGLATKKIVSYLSKRENYLAVNTQANAGNRGFNTISKYERADFFTLNSGELTLELRQKNLDYFQVVPKIMHKLNAKNAIITLGAEGLIAFQDNSSFKVPALATKVVDKVGAGDSVFAMGALLSYLNAPGEIMGFICNIVAAHEVNQLGHRSSLELGDIKKQLKSTLS